MKKIVAKAASLLLAAAPCSSPLAASIAYAGEPEAAPTPISTVTPDGPDGASGDRQEPGIMPMDDLPDGKGVHY